MRILTSLNRLSRLFSVRLKDNNKERELGLATHADRPTSFSDHIEEVAAEHEWVRSRKRVLPKSLPRSPRGNDASQIAPDDYDDYVESLIDWIISIGEKSEQSADEIMALSRMFEAWSGWGRARPALLFRALTKAGVPARRIYLKPNDLRYKSKKKELNSRPYIVVYQLNLPGADTNPKSIAA